MRSQVAKILRRGQELKTVSSVSSRALTTTSDPRKSSNLAVGVKEDFLPQGTVQDSLFPSLALPNADVFTHTFQKISKWQNKTFTECGLTGRQYTFGETYDASLRWGAAMKNKFQNVQNPTVAFLSVNSPDYVVMFFGCLAAGVTITSINPMYTPEEIAFQLKDSGAALLVVDSVIEPLADVSLKFLGKDLPVVVSGKSKQGRPAAQEIFLNPSAPKLDSVDVDPKSIAFLPYSSGTTGKPKGVKLSHSAITNNMSMYMNEFISGLTDAEGDHQDQQLGLLPFFHIYGLMATLLASAFYGSKIVTMPKFEPTLFISTLKKHKMTSLQVVPPLLQFINDCPMITSDDLSQLHSCIIGAAPVKPSLALTIKEKLPDALFQEGYGMTETLLSHITAQGAERVGYCGNLLANSKAKIIDIDTGDVLPANTPGELYLQVPSVMTGYHNNDAATRETIDKDGWLRTGDIAIYTEDGYYAIVDRLKELIKVKGLQVAPSEVEEVLKQLPGIEDVGVVGIPHDQLGEAPRAFIVRSDSDLTERAVHTFTQEHLSKHKQLEGGIVFVDELPKNPMGKLLRRVLKGMATNQP